MNRIRAAWSHARPAALPPRVRAGFRWLTTLVAFVIVWFALVAPNQLAHFSPGAFLRVPIEGLLLVLLALVLPPRARTITAAIVGLLLGVLVIVKILDMGFYDALDRPFNPVTDWSYLGPAAGVLRDSVGSGRALAIEILALIIVTSVVVLVPLSLVRLTKLTARHRIASLRGVAVLGAVWIVCAALGIQTGVRAPVASTSAATLAVNQVQEVRAAIKDQKTFEATISATDPYAITPGANLLTGLRGKDVIVAFVESYGQVAVQNSSFSPGVDQVLTAGATALANEGYSSQSAFLDSPTFGGISWLAHSTFQSGLWINNQQRYNQLISSSRFTLSDAFKRAGWRTVGDVPSNTQRWPEGTSFYHYDKLYDEHNVGYAGPKFSYASMPDQYSLAAFQRMELQPGHAPVMAEIDLVTSHTPWTPLPHLISWDQVGNGSVYNGMPEQGQSPSVVWQSSSQVKKLYGQSVEYSMGSLISWVQQLHDDNLVLILLGDHQPATIVSGSDATHEVPITIIAHDPSVMQRISSWNWESGLLPSPKAPVWPMDSFRDRFLSAFGPHAPAAPVANSPPGH